jgi:hypothetical protein
MYYTILTILLVALILTGCRTENMPLPAKDSTNLTPYPDLGLAPELTNDTWLNTDTHLRLDDLQGKVIIIDMWRFG